MKKFNLLAIIAIIGITASCNHKDNYIPSENRTKVKFSSSIITAIPATKAIDITWEPNDAIGIYMFERNATTVVEEKSNVKYVTQGGSTNTSFVNSGNIIYFPDNGDEVRFMSYYPYTNEITSNIYKVDVSSQTSQKDIDLLYSFKEDGYYSKATPGKTIPLTFEHKLTKIIINVKSGEGIDAEDLETLQVGFTGLNTQADFDLINGSLTNLSEVAAIEPKNASPKDGYQVGYEAIVLPTTEIEGAKIVFTLNSEDEFSWDFNKALAQSTKYTFNVTINRSGIVVVATIKEWLNGGEEDIDAE